MTPHARRWTRAALAATVSTLDYPPLPDRDRVTGTRRNALTTLSETRTVSASGFPASRGSGFVSRRLPAAIPPRHAQHGGNG